MNFDQRLEQAIDRGTRHREARSQAEQQRTLTEAELRNLHSSARLNISEHIETVLRKLSDHFPGFRFETIVEDAGWGARISRDDLQLGRGSRESQYSRFQILITPFSPNAKIVEAVAKGTVRNKELFHRSHFQFLSEFEESPFKEVIDLWALEFAESYAAQD